MIELLLQTTPDLSWFWPLIIALVSVVGGAYVGNYVTRKTKHSDLTVIGEQKITVLEKLREEDKEAIQKMRDEDRDAIKESFENLHRLIDDRDKEYGKRFEEMNKTVSELSKVVYNFNWRIKQLESWRSRVFTADETARRGNERERDRGREHYDETNGDEDILK